MATALVLVAPVHGLLGLTNGLFVGHLGQVGDHGQVVLAAQAIDGQGQVHLALPPQNHLVGIAVLLPPERGVFFEEFGEGSAQFDLIATLFGGDGQGIDRVDGRSLGQRRRDTASGEGIAGLGTFQAGNGYNATGLGLAQAGLLGAHQVVEPPHTVAVQTVAIPQRAAPDPHQG